MSLRSFGHADAKGDRDVRTLVRRSDVRGGERVGGGERDQEQVPRVRDGAEMEACVFIVNQSTSSFNVRRASAPTLRSLNPHSISAGLPSSGTNAGDTPSSPSSSLSSPPSSTTAPCMLIVEGPFLCMDTCPAEPEIARCCV